METLQFGSLVPQEENYNDTEPTVRGRGERVQDLPGLLQSKFTHSGGGGLRCFPPRCILY